MSKLVIVESPYRGNQLSDRSQNVAYAWECVSDCIRRNEIPFASHLFYPHVLNEDEPLERQRGIDFGYAWSSVADLITFYTDRGWSEGMLQALKRSTVLGFRVEYRSLNNFAVPPPRFVEYDPVEETTSHDQNKD